MNIIHVEDTKILDEFYDNWDLTFEGTTTDSDNLKFLIDWFKKHNVNMKYGLLSSRGFRRLSYHNGNVWLFQYLLWK